MTSQYYLRLARIIKRHPCANVSFYTLYWVLFDTLNAPIYLCTNAKKLQLFRRGVEQDTCIVDCLISDLPACWHPIHLAIQNTAV